MLENTHQIMYSTKTIHKYINPNYPQVYNTVGDPYKSNNQLNELPARWKNKQFVIPKIPKNAQNGYFYKLKYNSEPYIELAEKYAQTQPLEKRMLGFGSHDACKRGEFTSSKATERYRSVVKQEMIQAERNKDRGKERKYIEKWKASCRTWIPPRDRNGQNLKFPTYLYDYGRTNVTEYSPNSSRDSFYKPPKHAQVDARLKGKDTLRRLGSYRPMSASIGEQAWQYNYVKPKYGNTHTITSFFDKGHLEVKGV